MPTKRKAARKPPAKLTQVYLFETRPMLEELAEAEHVSLSDMMRSCIRRQYAQHRAALDTAPGKQ